MRKIIEPLHVLNKKTILTLIVVETVVALTIWQLAGGGLIPSPLKIGREAIAVLGSVEFYDNFFSSLSLTMQGMGISLIIALFFSYHLITLHLRYFLQICTGK